MTDPRIPKRIWDFEVAAAALLPPPPHPVPLVAARPAEMGEIAKNALALMLLAYKHGWSVRTTYAHGWLLTAKGTAGKLVESIAVRMWRETERLVGIWHDGGFDCAMSARLATFGYRELVAFVASYPLRGAVQDLNV